MVSKMTKNKKTVKTTAPAAAVEKKETPVAPVDSVKEAAAPAVDEKKEVKEVKEAPAKKAAPKTAEKKEEQEKSANVYLQYGGKQFSTEEIVEKAKAAAAEEAGLKRLSSIKSIDIYCKPEEHAAYYVANDGKFVGRIDL